ncbi:MAG: hypothetical protein QME46_00115 [Thermoanaerobacteraceae bacterium]|nr:hypothetical protein [Thermoanaerobacteraceae bacterium]
MLQRKVKITGKGQVQIPANIRKYIGSDIGDNVIFKTLHDGRVVIGILK